MEQLRQENVWMVCLNCEYEYAMEELFSDGDEIACPLCNSMSYRTTTELGESFDDIPAHYHRNDFSDDYN